MSKDAFEEFINENQNTIFHFHEIRGFKASYRGEKVEIKGTINSNTALNPTASVWELLDALDGNSIVVKITNSK